MIKNTPNKIFLNIGTDEKDLDFDALARVTWSNERVFDSDLEYISSVFILRRVKELEKEKFDTTTKHGVHDFNVNSAIISELRNLLKNGN